MARGVIGRRAGVASVRFGDRLGNRAATGIGAKMPPTRGAERPVGWICDDPLCDGKTKIRTFIWWLDLAEKRRSALGNPHAEADIRVRAAARDIRTK